MYPILVFLSSCLIAHPLHVLPGITSQKTNWTHVLVSGSVLQINRTNRINRLIYICTYIYIHIYIYRKRDSKEMVHTIIDWWVQNLQSQCCSLSLKAGRLLQNQEESIDVPVQRLSGRRILTLGKDVNLWPPLRSPLRKPDLVSVSMDLIQEEFGSRMK